jgi:hypothetical protein
MPIRAKSANAITTPLIIVIPLLENSGVEASVCVTVTVLGMQAVLELELELELDELQELVVASVPVTAPVTVPPQTLVIVPELTTSYPPPPPPPPAPEPQDVPPAPP